MSRCMVDASRGTASSSRGRVLLARPFRVLLCCLPFAAKGAELRGSAVRQHALQREDGFGVASTGAALVQAGGALLLDGAGAAAWGPRSHGSCRHFGCRHHLPIGQACGCYPGCADLGICCGDYREVCAAGHGNRAVSGGVPVPRSAPFVPREASCAAYECRAKFVSWHQCQCTPLCAKFGNCCADYDATCAQAPPRPVEGSCADFGCPSAYVAGHACQCNDACHGFGNCCPDFAGTCQAAGTCASYGCAAGYQAGHACQCNPECALFGNCCADQAATCPGTTPPATSPEPPGSCEAYGCQDGFAHADSCQCNSQCVEYGNCCEDFQDRCAAVSTSPMPSPWDPSNAELFTFYVYRSQSDAVYPPKNTNAANLPGVMWYLQHEVVTQSPPKFGITRILRYKVKAKAPSALLRIGMNFGVRYAYDSQACTGPGNCDVMFENFGFFVGCNKFESMYPYPTDETHFSGGAWYSLPGAGNCEGTPTGAANCTYSHSWPPDEISLAELEGESGGDFWAHPQDAAANSAKVQAAADAFKLKYPDSEELEAAPCDFSFAEFWS